MRVERADEGAGWGCRDFGQAFIYLRCESSPCGVLAERKVMGSRRHKTMFQDARLKANGRKLDQSILSRGEWILNLQSNN